MDTIAEDFERDGNLAFRQFLSRVKASAKETRLQLYPIIDHDYVNIAEM